MSNQLESRKCACGCGLTFKCMPTSKQRYRSRFCEASCTEGGLTALHRRDMLSKSKEKRGPKKLPFGYISTGQLSEHLGVSEWTVREWVKKGLIPCMKIADTLQCYRLEDVKSAMVRNGVIVLSKESDTRPEQVTEDITQELLPDGGDDLDVEEDEWDTEEEGQEQVDPEDQRKSRLCGNPACPNTTQGEFCCQSCALSTRPAGTSPTLSEKETDTSSTKARGGRFDPSLTAVTLAYGNGKHLSDCRNVTRIAREILSESGNTIVAGTTSLTRGTSGQSSSGGCGRSQREGKTLGEAGNESEKTDNESEGFGGSGMQGTERGTALARLQGETEGTSAESSVEPVNNFDVERSRTMSLIDESATVLLDCMKSANKRAQGQELMDFRQVNSIANVGKQIAQLAKVKLDAIKEARK